MSPSSSTWGDAQTKAQLGKLREAERLYLRAAEAAGNGSIKKMILAQVPELEGEGNAQVGVQYSLKVREINGTSHVANPYTTSREDVVKYLEMSLHRRLEDHTYFPVRAHTPDVLIATLQAAGFNITDKPMAMQATKARQSQMEDEPPEKNKMKVRYHAMKPGEILEVIDKLSHPDVVIHQADRIKKVIVNGKVTIVPAPDNFAVFVTIDSGKECVAIIEFDSKMGKDDIIYDGQGEEYHTTVTVFEPDVVWKGLPFDYVEYLLLNPNNRELDIKTESPQSDAAYGETLATTSNQGLSDNSIPQNSDLSTETAKKVSDDGGQRGKHRETSEGAEGSEVTDDDVVFSRKQQMTDDPDRASRELTMADLRAMDARDTKQRLDY